MAEPNGSLRGTLLTAAIVVVIAGAAMYAAIKRAQPIPTTNPPASRPAVSAPTVDLPRQYKPAGIIGGDPLFAEHLAGLAMSPDDQMYAAGDRQVWIFDHCARRVGGFALSVNPTAIAVGADGVVYIGRDGAVEKLAATGDPIATIGKDVIQKVTGLALRGDELLVADGAAGLIRRFNADGVHTGDLSPPTANRFRLPNNRLDVAVDADGLVLVTHSGPHLIESYDAKGQQTTTFGGYSTTDPALFGGCCNPTGLAVAPDGDIVATQKAPACVKVFDTAGTLLGRIGPEYFHEANTQMDLAVDRSGRIYVADTQNRRIRLFAAK